MDGSIGNMIRNVVFVIVGIVVIFYIVGGTSTVLTQAANNISSSGLPLAGLFASNGVVLLIFMAGVLLAIIVLAFGISKVGKR